MKKILSFTILFIPWLLSFTLLPFSKIEINYFLLYFIFISILFYIYFNLYIYNRLKYNSLNNNFILVVLILYILNQSFNILILYYNAYFLSIVVSIISFIPILLLMKNQDI